MAKKNIISSVIASVQNVPVTSDAPPVLSPNMKADLFLNYGVQGESLTSAYNHLELRTDSLKPSDYRLMIDNDGQVQMLYLAIANTILSAGYDFIDDDSKSEEDSPELAFIKETFETPMWSDGMKIPLRLVLKQMMRAFIDGYRVFEIVYKKRDDGMIGIEKIAPRSSIAIDGIKLLRDYNDEFLGFWQRVPFAGKFVDITIKNEGLLKKALLVIYGAEFGSMYGRSGFKAAWYHYDKAHKAMFLNHVGHELGAVKYRKLMTKGASQDQIMAAVGVLERAHEESVIALPDAAFDLSFESLSDAAVMKVGMDQQDRDYEMIARSVLAQFVLLGGTSGSGNRSLGQTQTEFFKQGLQSTATTLLEEPINSIIADLINVNFGTKVYPQLKVKPIDDKASQIIMDAFIKIIEKGTIPPSVQEDIIEKAAEKIGLDIDSDVLGQEIDQQTQNVKDLNNPDSAIPPEDSTVNTLPGRIAKDVANLSEHNHMHLDDAGVGSNRALFPDEMKVKFADIKVHMDDAMIRSKAVLLSKLTQTKQSIIDAYLKAIRENRKAITNIDIQLTDTVGDQNYSNELLATTLLTLEYGKIGSANELQKPVPNTSKSDRDWALMNTKNIVNEQGTRLKLRLQQIANIGLDHNIPEQDIRTQLEQEFDAFINTAVAGTVSALLPQAFNKGRQITFDKYESEIFAYRWTAHLEGSCPYCTAMDGKVMQSNDPQYYIMTPPAHFGCLCMWVPITYDEQKQHNIQVTGMPSDIPVYGSVSQFKQI